ncbi:hypothetical protein KBD71_01195 [Candidatus Woesebacteria bacterium]|nr:hypothetical protein [Candidatus Woesebacteria bacterium]
MNLEGVDTSAFTKAFAEMEKIIGADLDYWYHFKLRSGIVSPQQYESLVFLNGISFDLKENRIHEIRYPSESRDENQKRFDDWADYLKNLRDTIVMKTSNRN